MREQQALNKAMMEAVEFVHAEGWDAPPTLFGLVPTQLLVDELGHLDDSSPLTLVVQDLPEHILPGSEELGEYVSRIAWPREVQGVILAQEIVFKDASTGEDAEAPEAAELTAPKIGESRTSGLCGEADFGLLGRGWTTP